MSRYIRSAKPASAIYPLSPQLALPDQSWILANEVGNAVLKNSILCRCNSCFFSFLCMAIVRSNRDEVRRFLSSLHCSFCRAVDSKKQPPTVLYLRNVSDERVAFKVRFLQPHLLRWSRDESVLQPRLHPVCPLILVVASFVNPSIKLGVSLCIYVMKYYVFALESGWNTGWCMHLCRL